MVSITSFVDTSVSGALHYYAIRQWILCTVHAMALLKNGVNLIGQPYTTVLGGTAAHKTSNRRLGTLILANMKCCILIGLQSQLQQNKSWYTCRFGYLQHIARSGHMHPTITIKGCGNIYQWICNTWWSPNILREAPWSCIRKWIYFCWLDELIFAACRSERKFTTRVLPRTKKRGVVIGNCCY